MGRPSPECRSRLTSGKSPVRESRTPGSVGEVPGNRHLYPTTVDLQIRQSGHALQGVQSVRKEHGIGFIHRRHGKRRQHKAVVLDDREDFLALLMFVAGIADAISTFLRDGVGAIAMKDAEMGCVPQPSPHFYLI